MQGRQEIDEPKVAGPRGGSPPGRGQEGRERERSFCASPPDRGERPTSRRLGGRGGPPLGRRPLSLTLSPQAGRGDLICVPSPVFGRGLGGADLPSPARPRDPAPKTSSDP